VSSKITLITPPDKIFNQNKSIALVHPSEAIRLQAQEILAKSETHENVYMYTLNDVESDVDWLLTVCKMSDIVILDYDNSPKHVKNLAAYIISLPQTYWLTSSDEMLYNKLSNNRVYGLDSIEHLILGGSFETEQ